MQRMESVPIPKQRTEISRLRRMSCEPATTPLAPPAKGAKKMEIRGKVGFVTSQSRPRSGIHPVACGCGRGQGLRGGARSSRG